MGSGPNLLVVPRPVAHPATPARCVSAPPEAAFTAVFGAQLPAARYLATSYGQLAYYSFPGAATSNDRILLIHGVQTPALGLLPLVRRLRCTLPEAHFTLFDHPGHGLSDTPLVPHVPALFVGIIDALLDHLSWPAVHLLGFSFGGCTAAAFAVSHPTRVQSVALVAPAGLISGTDLEATRLEGDEWEARKYIIEYLEGGNLVVPDDWQDRVSRGEIVAEAVRDWQMKEHSGHAASVVGIFRDGGVIDNREVFVHLRNTGLHVVAVLGELDGVCNHTQLKELGFEDVTIVPGADHAVVRSRVPEVAAVMERFWRHHGVA